MATSSTGPVLDPKSTHPTEMPPMVVTTAGIPAQEHVAAPAEEPRSHRTLWIALALAGVIAFAFGVIIYAINLPPAAVPTTHMGLSDSAWSQYRADERTGVAMPGPASADWQTYRSGER